jgi:hypothetical protein
VKELEFSILKLKTILLINVRRERKKEKRRKEEKVCIIRGGT